MLSLDDRPRALFGYSDYAAIEAVEAAAELGLRVPEDVAVLGVGDSAAGRLLERPLTSAAAPDSFARIAALILDRALAESYTPARHVLTWEINRRGSTA